jgi:hypothetical protein
MDSVTLGAILLAIVTGAGGGLGGELWDGVGDLVRRPFRRGHRPGDTTGPASSGAAELAALEQAHGDEAQAVALAVALLARAEEDTRFFGDLEAWWARANRELAGIGSVINTISGGNQQGPVLQGRDFSSLTFGCTAVKGPPHTTSQS